MMIFAKLLEPRYRMVVITVWGFAISGIAKLEFLSILNLIAMLAFMIQIKRLRQSYRMYLKKWLKYHVLTLLMVITLNLRIDLSAISIDTQHLTLAAVLALRLNLLVVSLWLAFMNVTEQQLLQSIVQLPIPLKLQRLFILTVRYIAVLNKVNQTIALAMKARGFQAKCDKRSFLVLSQRVVLLLIHALNKVEKSQLALKARGFKI